MPVGPPDRICVNPRAAKYSHLPKFGFAVYVLHPASIFGGAFRGRHETRGGDAVDADVPRTNGMEADDEIVWSWRPKALAPSPSEAESFAGATVANEKVHRGDHV